MRSLPAMRLAILSSWTIAPHWVSRRILTTATDDERWTLTLTTLNFIIAAQTYFHNYSLLDRLSPLGPPPPPFLSLSLSLSLSLPFKPISILFISVLGKRSDCLYIVEVFTNSISNSHFSPRSWVIVIQAELSALLDFLFFLSHGEAGCEYFQLSWILTTVS